PFGVSPAEVDREEIRAAEDVDALERVARALVVDRREEARLERGERTGEEAMRGHARSVGLRESLQSSRKRTGSGGPPGLQNQCARPERGGGWVRFPYASANENRERRNRRPAS